MNKPTKNAYVFSLLALTLALLPQGACHKDDAPPSEGESHFLETCAITCGDGLQCLCGVCTLPCGSSTMCSALSSSATCGVGGICGGSAANTSICQVTCKDSSACTTLGSGFTCESGACVRRLKSDGGVSALDGSTETPDSAVVVQMPLDPNKVDVLFMIDNSGSMKEEQDALKLAMPTFMAGLQTRFGAGLDLHVGFVTSDVGAGNTFITGNPACNRPGGDRGLLQVRPGCGLENGSFLAYSQQGAAKNFTGELSQVVGCMAELGASGCGFEHQLQAVRLALDPVQAPTNAGFVRSDARLLLILLSDEDDCSGAPTSTLYSSNDYPGTTGSLRCSIEGHLCNGTKPPMTAFSTPLSNCVANPTPVGLLSVSELVAAVRATKPAGGIDVMVLAGAATPNAVPAPYAFDAMAGQPSVLDSAPACATGNGSATPALRLRTFAEAFNGVVRSICEPTFDDSMTIIAKKRN